MSEEHTQLIPPVFLKPKHLYTRCLLCLMTYFFLISPIIILHGCDQSVSEGDEFQLERQISVYLQSKDYPDLYLPITTAEAHAIENNALLLSSDTSVVGTIHEISVEPHRIIYGGGPTSSQKAVQGISIFINATLKIGYNCSRSANIYLKLPELAWISRKDNHVPMYIQGSLPVAFIKTYNRYDESTKFSCIPLKTLHIRKTFRVSNEKNYEVLECKRKVSTLTSLGLIGETVECYEKLIEFDPTDAEAYHNLGRAYGYKGEIEKSIKYIRKAIELEPREAKNYHSMARYYEYKKMYSVAIEWYKKAIEYGKNEASEYSAIGSCYFHSKNYDKSIEWFNKLIELEPDNKSAYLSIGSSYVKKGNYDDAIEYLETAINLDSTYAHAYYGLGIAYIEKENVEKGREYFEKAAQLGDPQAQKLLADIQKERNNVLNK